MGNIKKCKFESCDKPAGKLGFGLCDGHYYQHQNKGYLSELRPRTSKFDSPRICKFPECGRKHQSSGYCASHYIQYRNGEPLKEVKKYQKRKPNTPKYASLTEYVEAKKAEKVQVSETGCWEWQGSRSSTGYGQARYLGEVKYIHRLFFEAYKGEISENRDVDHICNNRRCCNPDHLQLLPRRLNTLRGTGHEAFATDEKNWFLVDGERVYWHNKKKDYRHWSQALPWIASQTVLDDIEAEDLTA